MITLNTRKTVGNKVDHLVMNDGQLTEWKIRQMWLTERKNSSFFVIGPEIEKKFRTKHEAVEFITASINVDTMDTMWNNPETEKTIEVHEITAEEALAIPVKAEQVMVPMGNGTMVPEEYIDTYESCAEEALEAPEKIETPSESTVEKEVKKAVRTIIQDIREYAKANKTMDRKELLEQVKSRFFVEGKKDVFYTWYIREGLKAE